MSILVVGDVLVQGCPVFSKIAGTCMRCLIVPRLDLEARWRSSRVKVVMVATLLTYISN